MGLGQFTTRGVPKALVAITGLLWAGMVWSDHRSQAIPQGGKAREVLVKYFDRDLRVLEAGGRASEWQGWLGGASDAEGWLRETKARVGKMDRERLGDEADGLLNGLRLRLGEEVERNPARENAQYRADLKEWLLDGYGRAWDYDLYLHHGEDADVRRSYQSENDRLLRRARWMSMAYFSITLMGVGCLFFVFLKRGNPVAPASRMPWRWAWSSVLGAFFLANLLLVPWLWLVGTGYGLYYGLGGKREIYVLYDLLWRVFPALLLGFLFLKNPVRLWRVFGMGRRVRWPLVLACMTFFAAFDWALFYLTPDIEVDPTDFMETAVLSRRGLAALLFSSALVAPVCEEIVFRGFLFQGLRRTTGTFGAALISSGLFALTHTQYDLLGWLSVGMMGLAACWLTLRTGSLKSAIALHVLTNLLIFTDVFFRYQMRL